MPRLDRQLATASLAYKRGSSPSSFSPHHHHLSLSSLTFARSPLCVAVYSRCAAPSSAAVAGGASPEIRRNSPPPPRSPAAEPSLAATAHRCPGLG
ncbi:hypothetical protein DAI22_03g363950 [Oryza sativa Japonica Group]|nr:hypothetical protein DAI22_03g363950 [Oryza sativa Japonica Group]